MGPDRESNGRVALAARGFLVVPILDGLLGVAIEEAIMDRYDIRPRRGTQWESPGVRGRRRRRQSLPPSILLVTCGAELHRLSLPSRGPIVLLDHPDRQLVEAVLARDGDIEGCLDVLRRVRARSSNNGWGWYMWLVHISPKFGQAGWTIRERLREFDERRKLRHLLRDVDLG